MQKILRINMTAMSARYEDVPGEFIRLGASCHKKNRLIKQINIKEDIFPLC